VDAKARQLILEGRDLAVRATSGRSSLPEAALMGVASTDALEATELEGKAVAAAKEIYFRRWPDGRTRESWPNITYFKLRPRWIRHSDFSRPPPRIVELAASR
jgi:hypothetical protein